MTILEPNNYSPQIFYELLETKGFIDFSVFDNLSKNEKEEIKSKILEFNYLKVLILNNIENFSWLKNDGEFVAQIKNEAISFLSRNEDDTVTKDYFDCVLKILIKSLY